MCSGGNPQVAARAPGPERTQRQTGGREQEGEGRGGGPALNTDPRCPDPPAARPTRWGTDIGNGPLGRTVSEEKHRADGPQQKRRRETFRCNEGALDGNVRP